MLNGELGSQQDKFEEKTIFNKQQNPILELFTDVRAHNCLRLGLYSRTIFVVLIFIAEFKRMRTPLGNN
ncbi:hypothetical protein BpHYR1_035172 [Brachionus plicatilis]|uniref:Uncharacterized protein n=1 Tax=Brachionus plicatilis TaxID=10195 RepID=A0A3M7SFY9_BRAPC|nr:hypothetical protein BpHYR1_035172 [Brachionus plicatilis]